MPERFWRVSTDHGSTFRYDARRGEEQQEQLRAIVRKHTRAHQLVVRAQIILLAAEGRTVHETARRLGIARTTVQI